MTFYHRHATPSHSSIHSSRDHFIQPPSLIDRSINYLNQKSPTSDDDEKFDSDDYGLPRPSSSSRKTHHARSLSRWRQQLFTLPALLTLTWFLVLYWGERHVFHSSIRSCDWSQWERWPSEATPHHVVLVADPQLVDPHTYPGRPWPLSSFTVRHTDLYLRRAFLGIQKLLQPDTVFFLGDLFDGGREWSTEESKSPETRWRKYGKSYWMKEYERWGRIFLGHWIDGGMRVRNGQRGRKLIAGLPGNHDLGFAKGIEIPVRKRFNAFFGEGNRVDVVGNHTFVSVDTVSLSAMDQGGEEELWRPAKDFLEEIQTIKKRAIINELITQNLTGIQRIKYPHRRLTPKDLETIQTNRRTQQDQTPLPSLPTILLSHIPLYRAPETPCGPHREHRHPPSILIQKGYQYQNVLTPQISDLLINKLTNTSSSTTTTKDPTTILSVFSGDDHDYCSVTHTAYKQPVKEITVKSLSWAMGIRKPGFVMVTLWNPLSPLSRNSDITDTAAAANPQKQAEEKTTTTTTTTIQTHLCLLPDQLGIFLRVYVLLFLVTISTIAVRAWWRVKNGQHRCSRSRPGDGGYYRPKQQYALQGRGARVKMALRDVRSTLFYMALVVGGWYVYLWR